MTLRKMNSPTLSAGGTGTDSIAITIPRGAKLCAVSVQTGTVGSGREIRLFITDLPNYTSGMAASVIPLAHGVQDSGPTNNLTVTWQAGNPDNWLLDEYRVVVAEIYGMVAGETADLNVAFDL